MSKKYTELLEKLKQDLAADMQYDVFIKSGVFEYINNIIKSLKDNGDDKFHFTNEKIKSITDEITNNVDINNELKGKASELWDKVKDMLDSDSKGNDIPKFDPNVNWFTQKQKLFKEDKEVESQMKKTDMLINKSDLWIWDDVTFEEVTKVIDSLNNKKSKGEISGISNIVIVEEFRNPGKYQVNAYIRRDIDMDLLERLIKQEEDKNEQPS